MIDILVVDDNLQLRETLRTILNKRPGFQVVGHHCGSIFYPGQPKPRAVKPPSSA